MSITIDEVTLQGLVETAAAELYQAILASAESVPVPVDPPPLSFSGDWLLATDYYEPARLTMEIVYPAPAAESSDFAHYKNAYPGMTWETDINVKGGAWPFLFEVTEGPTGMTVGQFLTQIGDALVPGDDYGVLKWDNPVEGVHPVSIKVTDQDGTIVTQSWNLVVGVDNFIFVDVVSGDDVLGDGTITNPLQTFNAGVYKEDIDSTYLNKIVVFRAGTYTINNGTPYNNAILDYRYKPLTYLSYPGEVVVWDTTTGHISSGTAGSPDLYIGDINYDGYRNDVNNSRINQIGSTAERIKFYKCHFDNIEIGLTGTDNPACIIGTDVGATPRKRIVVSRCSTGANCKVQLAVMFSTDLSIYENNSTDGMYIEAGNGRFFLQCKDSCSNFTVRNNVAINVTSGDGTSVIAFTNQDINNTNQESCYNRISYTSPRNVENAIIWNSQTSGTNLNSNDYRNSHVNFKGYGARFVTNTNGDPVRFKSNVVYGLYNYIQGDFYVDEGNLLAALTDIDTEARLVGDARTLYLGKYGAEIAPVYRV